MATDSRKALVAAMDAGHELVWCIEFDERERYKLDANLPLSQRTKNAIIAFEAAAIRALKEE